MGSGPGSRLDNLKQAAKLGISTLLAVNTQYHTRSRVSLVPYSYALMPARLPITFSRITWMRRATLRFTTPTTSTIMTSRPIGVLRSRGCAECRTNEDGQTEFECTNIPYDFVVESNGKSKDGCAADRKEPASAGSSYQFSDANPSTG